MIFRRDYIYRWELYWVIGWVFYFGVDIIVWERLDILELEVKERKINYFVYFLK